MAGNKRASDPAMVVKGWVENYFTTPNRIYDCDITGYSKAVYIYLCRKADNSTKQSMVTYEEISKSIGFSLSSVRRAVDQLEAVGLLVVSHVWNGMSMQRANVYTVMHPDDAEDVRFVSKEPKTKGQCQKNRGVLTEHAQTAGCSPRTGRVFSQNRQGVLPEQPTDLKDSYKQNSNIKDNNKQKDIDPPHGRVKSVGISDPLPKEEQKTKGVELVENALGVSVPKGTKTKIIDWMEDPSVGLQRLLSVAKYIKSKKRDWKNPVGAFVSAVSQGWEIEENGQIEKPEEKDPRYKQFYEIFPD